MFVCYSCFKGQHDWCIGGITAYTMATNAVMYEVYCNCDSYHKTNNESMGYEQG